MEKLEKLYLSIRNIIENTIEDFVNEERGDTNFISIAIILAIVLVLAIAFIGFKDQIMGVVKEKIEQFMNTFKGIN